jgi:hypothetical protein
MTDHGADLTSAASWNQPYFFGPFANSAFLNSAAVSFLTLPSP